MCINAPPLKDFIATDFNDTLVVSTRYTPETLNVSRTTTTTITTRNSNGDSAILDAAIKDDVFKEVASAVSPRIGGVSSRSSNNLTLFSVDNEKITFADYRDGVKSWFPGWQDPFILSVFLLLALLSIGSIIAFKV